MIIQNRLKEAFEHITNQHKPVYGSSGEYRLDYALIPSDKTAHHFKYFNISYEGLNVLGVVLPWNLIQDFNRLVNTPWGNNIPMLDNFYGFRIGHSHNIELEAGYSYLPGIPYKFPHWAWRPPQTIHVPPVMSDNSIVHTVTVKPNSPR